MINILAVSASPIERSSTDILLHTVAESITKELSPHHEATITFVKLNELKFIPCQSCGEDPSPKFCLFDDDLTPVYEQLAKCDCLLFGTPVYFDSVSAQAKMFIDRCNCVQPPDYEGTSGHHFIRRIHRQRPGAMVIVGGQRGWFEGARRVIAGFFKWVEVTNEGMITYQSANPTKAGEVATDKETLRKAEELGRTLADKINRNRER